MSVPKKKTSKSKRDMRRSHDTLKAVNTVTCPNCDSPMRLHRVCPSCGQYKGMQVVVEKVKSEETQPTEENTEA